MPDQTRSIEKLEILGGVYCLDFANTINSRHAPVYDYIRNYSDLVDWAVRAGGVPAKQAMRLQDLAQINASSAEETLRKALKFREMLYQLFSKIAMHSEHHPGEMLMFVDIYAEAIAHSTFIWKEDHFSVEFEFNEKLDSLLWPIFYSAGQILLSAELTQVKECPNCGWLFVDRSKNQSRRWCSMESCGARDKMRRYQKKLRARKS